MPTSTAAPTPGKPDEIAVARHRRKGWRMRTLMAFVVVAALALGLGVPAYRIAEDRDYHVHTSLIVSPDRREWFLSPVFEPSPFWPRYWAYLRGRPWKGPSFCRTEGRSYLEDCILAHPEAVEHAADGSTVQFRLTPAQRAGFDRAKAVDPSAVAYGLDRKPIQ